jgi:hypothetical protein
MPEFVRTLTEQESEAQSFCRVLPGNWEMTPISDLIVVVPAYCEVLKDWERFAFLNNIRRLGKHTFALVVPQSMDCSQYVELAPSIEIVRFPDDNFRSADSYSLLCLSDHFYAAFSAYRYLLICQLDAYIFSSEINHWISLDIDFVGGAVSKSDPQQNQFIRWINSLNGGLSLRNVASHRRVLKSKNLVDCERLSFELHRDMAPTTAFMDRSPYYRAKLALHAFAARCRSGFKDLTSSEFITGLRTGQILAEDQFWSRFAPRFDPSFKVASLAEAKLFSAQFSLDLTMSLFRQHPPFGCHGRDILTTMHRLSRKSDSPAGAYEMLVAELMVLTQVVPKATGHLASSKNNFGSHYG